MSGKSVFDLDEKIAGLLTYVLCFFSGIFFLIAEKENKFVRFHALQSTVWFLFLLVLTFVVNLFWWIPLLGGLLAWIVRLVWLVSWIYLMYMAYKGATFKIPVLGDAVWNQIYNK